MLAGRLLKGSPSALSSPRASMVLIFRPAALPTGIWHDRVATPSIFTVHAPQSPLPQPNLVPVMSKWSRSTQSNGVSSSASTSCILPLTLIVLAMLEPSPKNQIIRQYFEVSDIRIYDLRVRCSMPNVNQSLVVG